MTTNLYLAVNYVHESVQLRSLANTANISIYLSYLRNSHRAAGVTNITFY